MVCCTVRRTDVNCSVKLHPGGSYYVAPLLRVGLDEGREFLGRAYHRLEHVDVEEFLSKFRVIEHPPHVGIDLGDDVGRRPAWREQPEPGHGLKTREPTLGNRRYIGKSREALTAADSEQLHPSCLPRLNCRTRVDKHHLNVPGHHIGESGRRSLVMNSNELYAGLDLQHFHVQVPSRANAKGPIVELTRLFFGKLDQFLHVLHWHGRARYQRLVDADEAGDRYEILHWVVRKLVVEPWVDDKRRLGGDEH